MKQAGTVRKPYTGQKKAIVIALDVGTTFSGVSYALLDPGEIPKIYEVTRFPGQEHQAGNPKIPSVIWYDRHGDAVKAGAEAEEQSNVNTAEEQGWTKVELFKLRLRPKSMKLEMNGMKLPHLPKSKSALEVFGDFLKYLFRCTRSFIIETHAGGAAVWKTVENDIQFILSHPNGWEGAQQSKMRKAAIYGGLVPDTDEGKARVRFVTEGEASLHACVLNGLADDVLSSPSRHGFVVADAGGGTLDISSYAIKGTAPLLIEEIAPPDCLFSGSVFVSRRARKFLEQKLNGSAQYGASAMLDHITKRFDETTKRLFRSRTENQYLHFGSPLDKDNSVGIRNGKLKLTGDEVADLFEPSIEAAVASIRNQVVLSGGSVKSVWLVGGFASSPWLFNQLQERLEPDGIVVSRPDGQTSKAVANGAIGFYCDHHVGARIAKYMYGVEFLREFDAADPEHVDRQSRLFQLPSGPKLLPDAFDCILARNSRVKESTTFSRKYCTELTSLSTLAVFEIEIWCYRGPGEQPKWILRGQDDFSTLCFVRADLSPLTASAKAMTGPGGKKYWTIVFSIEIHFGLTEFKARIKWTDDGKVKYGPASIVYDEGGNKELEDDRDSQDEISAVTPSRYGSRAPSMAPSRTHSASNTPQTVQSPVEERSAVGTTVSTTVGTSMSRSHSTSQSPGDRHPEGYADSSVSKKSKSSSSHHRSSSQQLSPNPSNVSHHTSRSERSQNSAHSSQHPSQRSASPREIPRDISRLSPAPREVLHPTVSQPVSREPSQLGQQTIIVTPTSTAPSQHHDREIPRSGRQTPNYYASTPTQSHVSQPQQPSPLPSVLGDNTSSISRTHGRSRSIATATQLPESTGVKFPSVSSVGAPSEVALPRSAIQSRTTSLTPSDSASNVHFNYLHGNGAVPGSISGSVVGSPVPETTVSKKSKKDKNRSLLSTIASASNSITKPPTEKLRPAPEPAPPSPQISIPASPSVSSSIGGSGLTTKPNTPINTRSLKSSLASSLSYATDRPEQPPAPQPPSMSRQNSDSVIAGGLGSALGGVLSNVWGSYKSTSASPIDNPPPGPATAAFESTLEPIMDVEVPGGFGGEHEREAPVPPQEEIYEPVIILPSPPKLEEPEPSKLPTPKTEIADLPTPQPTETVPQTPNPNEPEQSALSAADKKKNKKQREKERKEKEAQEKREREEQARLEREAQEKRDLEEREEKKRQKAEREARKKKEREEREEQERLERERIEREAREQAEREAEEQSARQAKEKAEREARELAERVERAEREAREAQERAEREAKGEAERAAKERTDKLFKKRADREAAKKEAEEKAKKEAKERADEAVRFKAERDRKKAEREAAQRAEREAREKAEQEAREEAERIAREKAEVEAEERERAEREAKEKADREKERLEREEKEREEKKAKEKADREAKEREEAEKKKSPPAWGSTFGKNADHSRKTSGLSPSLSRKEQKNGWADTWDSGFTQGGKKDEPSSLPQIITSSVPGGIFEGAGHFEFFANKDSPGGAGGGEEVELRTPLTKQGKGGIKSPSSLSNGVTPLETADLGKFDILEDPGMNNVSARVSVSSENERFTDAEQGPSPTETAHPTFAPEVVSEFLSNPTSEFLKTPQGSKEEVPMSPTPWLSAPLKPPQHQVLNPAPAPAKNEPEKPLSLWERKKPKPVSPAQPSGLFAGGDSTNSSGVWGDGGGNAETIAMPTLSGTSGDRQSIFTDTARDQKRENQRENLVEGFLGSSQARKRNDSAQSQVTTKPAPKPAPAPAQKPSGWGSWGSSLLGNIASVVANERSPSPEPAPVMPKIEGPPRGFTPSQPPKSQPAGFGSGNKPAPSAGGGFGDAPSWGGGGSGDNAWGGTTNAPPITQRTSTEPAWGGTKNAPLIAQKTSNGPAWGAKPTGGGFGPSKSTWGNNTGSTFASGVGRNLTVDTSTKPPESSPNTAGPENIPESAIEIKHVPAPGLFRSSITDLKEKKEKEEPAEVQEDSWGSWEESGKGKGSKGISKEASPVQEKAPEENLPEQPVVAEETQEPAKIEEVATPAGNEEDEFDWANTGTGKKKKKGPVASVAQTPSVPNTPDPDNADDGAPGGVTSAKKKKKRAKK